MKSNADYADDYVRRLQESVEYIKTNREMEARYMLWKEIIREERQEERLEAFAEIILEFLADLPGEISTELENLIWDESDPQVLKRYVHLSKNVTTIDEFERLIKCADEVQ